MSLDKLSWKTMNCLVCEKEFSYKASRKNVKFCSSACYFSVISKNMLKHTPERFWSKVEKTDGCWVWTGKSFGDFGYCRYGKTLVHRKSWELTFGKIPEGKLVLHKCDNPPCVRPSHLYVGTQKDNVRDMHERGRAVINPVYGEKNKLAKLTNAEVSRIRGLFDGRHGEMKRLAAQFDVSLAQISRILNNKSRTSEWRE